MNLKEFKTNNYMSIKHKFLETEFEKGFYTENATLKNNSFEPEVLFLGTFNPQTTDEHNVADFFYGRNWFWPLLFSIAEKDTKEFKQRKYYDPFKPSLEQILNFTTQYKLSFADLICEVLPSVDKENYQLKKNKITFSKKEYDLINDGDLIKLDDQDLVLWNTHLIDYLKDTPSIKTIYFTRKYDKAFSKILDKLDLALKRRNAELKFLYTPSGQALKGKPRYKFLKNQWLNSEKDDYDSIDASHFINKKQ